MNDDGTLIASNLYIGTQTQTTQPQQQSAIVLRCWSGTHTHYHRGFSPHSSLFRAMQHCIVARRCESLSFALLHPLPTLCTGTSCIRVHSGCTSSDQSRFPHSTLNSRRDSGTKWH